MQVTQTKLTFPDQAPRSGLHLSDIIKEIERDLLGDEARPDRTPDEVARSQAQWKDGELFEQAFKQYQVESDGVLMTPDAFDTVNKVVEEYKRTRYSTKRIGEWDKAFRGYLIQLKSYCRYYKTLKGRLVVHFVNGDYSHGRDEGQPVTWIFDLVFTRQELEDNWLWILSKKREMEARGNGVAVAKPYLSPGAQQAHKTHQAVQHVLNAVMPMTRKQAEQITADITDPKEREDNILDWLKAGVQEDDDE